MKNIVVTTDLSEKSEAAFAMAKTLAEKFHSTIHLLAIIEDPAQAAMMYALDFPVLPSADVQEQLRQKVEHDLAEFREKAFAGVPCELHVCAATEPVHNEIINFASSHSADLVVIATHGRTGLSRILIGSVAEKVVRQCPCPTLTVPS